MQSWAALEKHHQQAESGDLCSLLHLDDKSTELLDKRKDMLEPMQQAAINTDKAERVGTIQLKERRPRRIFTRVNSQWGELKKTEPNSSQSCPVTGPEAMDTN